MTAAPFPSILNVNDNPALLYVHTSILRRSGYLVHEASTGAAALELLRLKPDLVLLDIRLPDVDGQEICRQIKRAPATRFTKVLHVSAYGSEPEDRVAALDWGADGYLSDPVDPAELVASARSLLRLQEAERELQQQAAVLRTQAEWLELAHDTVIIRNPDGVITFWNRSAEEMYGWSREEALGKVVHSLLHTRFSDSLEALVQDLSRQGWWEGELVHTRRDGTEVVVASRQSIQRDGQGHPIAVLQINRDVTEQKRIGVERQQRVEELIEADRRKDEFLALLAHELRNPLGPIIQASYLLQEQPEGDQSQRALEIIDHQARHLARLVDDLLDVSRLSRGAIELHREILDLGSLVSQTVSDLQPTADARQLQVRFEVPPDPVWVNGDPIRLAQILSNLLHNAVKFTEPGGQVSIQVAHEGEAVLTVTDTGRGIPPEMLSRVFELFTQVDPSYTRSRDGLGIGLALVNQLVGLHGGTVQAYSAGTNQGSQFVVRLPVADEALVKVPSRDQDRLATSKDSLKVLVVEDNRDAAETLVDLLELWGHHTRVAYDGPAALHLARQWQPEVILLDIGLPGQDGFAVAAELRRDPLTCGAILFALTGYGQPEDQRRSAAAGIQRHFTKPVRPEQLQQALASIHPVCAHEG